YYAPSGQYADDSLGLSQGVITGPLAAPASASVGGNGVYHQGNGFPNATWQDSTYYVDVLFTPTTMTPYLQLSVNPSNPSIAADANETPNVPQRRGMKPIAMPLFPGFFSADPSRMPANQRRR